MIGGPGRGTLRSDPPSATCGWGCGCQWIWEGRRGRGECHLGGTPPRGRPGVGWTSCLAPPCPRRGQWEPGRWRRSVGARRGRASIPSLAAGPENAGVGVAGQNGSRAGEGVGGRPGSRNTPSATLNTHADTHAHAPPLGRCRRVLERFPSAQ